MCPRDFFSIFVAVVALVVALNPLQGHHKYKSHIVAFAGKKKVNVHLKDFQALFNPLQPPRCVERGHIYIQDFHLVSTLHLVVDLSLEENRYIFWYSLM